MSRFDRRAWLLPVVFAAHVAEEAPGSTDWARRHASERYTQADFLRNNAAGLALTAGRELAAGAAAARALHAAVVARQVFFIGERGPAAA